MKKLLLLFVITAVSAWCQNPVLRDFSCVAASSAGSDSYACDAAVAPASYAAIAGKQVCFTADVANTGAATFDLSSLGAVAIKKIQGGVTTDPATNDIRAGEIVCLRHDGTNWQLQNPLATAAGSGDFVGPSSSVDGEIVLFDSTTGKLGKRATGTGPARVTSGVLSADKGVFGGAGFEHDTAITGGTTVRKCKVATFGGTFTAYAITVAPSSASVTWKIWKNSSATAVPTNSDSISTSGWTLTGATKVRSATLSDLSSTAFAAGDNICFNLSAASSSPVETTIELEYQ